MQGLAVTPATLAISDGPTYDFGIYPSGAVAEKTFTVTNSGGTNATSVAGAGLSAPFSFKGGSYPGTGGTCAGTINSGASCTIVVRYAPVSIASHSSTIDLNYDNGLTTVSSSRSVAGQGVSPASLSLSDGPTFDYGLQPIGKTVDKTFILTNGGGYQLRRLPVVDYLHRSRLKAEASQVRWKLRCDPCLVSNLYSCRLLHSDGRRSFDGYDRHFLF